MKAQFLLAVLLISLPLVSFQYSYKVHSFSPRHVYEGSTPGGPFIRSALKIPGNITTEFIKWKVSISHANISVDTFNASLWYGESQPNTSGFKNGGHRLSFRGTYKLRNGGSRHHNKQILELHSVTLAQPLYLLQLNDRLFYFLDKNENLLIGNGGFGYVLNQSPHH